MWTKILTCTCGPFHWWAIWSKRFRNWNRNKMLFVKKIKDELFKSIKIAWINNLILLTDTQEFRWGSWGFLGKHWLDIKRALTFVIFVSGFPFYLVPMNSSGWIAYFKLWFTTSLITKTFAAVKFNYLSRYTILLRTNEGNEVILWNPSLAGILSFIFIVIEILAYRGPGGLARLS